MQKVQEVTETVAVQLGPKFVQVHVRSFLPETSKGFIFFLHDFLGNGNDFIKVGTLLASKGFSVVCPDLPGHGKSAFLAPENYSIPITTRVIAKIYEHYINEDCIIIGHDWGAIQAMLFAPTLHIPAKAVIALDLPTIWSVGDFSPATYLRQKGGKPETDKMKFWKDYRNILRLSAIRPVNLASLLEGRLMQLDCGFAIAADPGLNKRIDALSSRDFDTYKLIEKATSPLVLLYSKLVEKTSRQRLISINKTINPVHFVGDSTAEEVFHFQTIAQSLLLLGAVELVA